MMMRLFKKYISVHKPATIIYDETFYQILRETARHPIVLRMKLYRHHGTTNCYIHCLHVAYFNYKWCKALGLDYESATRAGMIHDLFLYDWHTHAKETGEYFHGLTHARRALRNAQRHFHLNSTEMDIIQNHMWPVTLLHIPHTKEGWIITLTDKYCGLLETLRLL